MKNVIGIRKETKDKTQRRAPLSPADVRKLVRSHGLRVLVEPWERRVFTDDEYRKAGAELTSDLAAANVVFGVKEVAPSHMLPDKAYVFFSHVIKGQAYNMPMLRHILDTNVSLFDYELVKNDEGKRTIAFGNFAGNAGLIDSIWALARRLDSEKVPHPFGPMQYATSYTRLDDARRDLRTIGEAIRTKGLGPGLTPFVVLATGYGRVAAGALELLRLLPVTEVAPMDLAAFMAKGQFSDRTIYLAQCRKPDLYRPKEPGRRFDLDDFNAHPERYTSAFEPLVPYASMLLHGIYWEPRFPKILTAPFLREVYRREKNPRLRVIGDITCDIGGSVEMTVRATTEQDPVFVFDPETGRDRPGVDGRGPVVLAVDKLPTELAWEASSAFSADLAPYVPELAATDFRRSYRDLRLSRPFKAALIAHRGSLTPDFRSLKQPVDENA